MENDEDVIDLLISSINTHICMYMTCGTEQRWRVIFSFYQAMDPFKTADHDVTVILRCGGSDDWFREVISTSLLVFCGLLLRS